MTTQSSAKTHNNSHASAPEESILDTIHANQALA